MSTPMLAAVLIVKDEEKNLPGCLESLDLLKPLLGEVIVYDTGSTDRTLDIARAHGATVIEGYWDADFARARNDATGHATAKWVLSIDADERVVAEVPRLRRLLQTCLTADLTGCDAIDVRIVDVDSSGHPLSVHPFEKLFRPSRARWDMPIHETLVSLRPGLSVRSVEAAASVIHLRHLGYADASERKGKAVRNAGVARSGVDLSDLTVDERARLFGDEARSLRVAGEYEQAEQCYEEALALQGLAVERTLLLLQGAVILATGMGQHAKAESYLRQMRHLAGDSDDIDWLEANLYMAMGEPERALPLLRSLRKVTLGSSLEMDGSVAVATLMEAAIAAGEFDEALACAIQLVASTADVGRYGPQLLRLWGDQAPELLAQLLQESSGGRWVKIASGLESMPGPGPSVAEHLRRRAKGVEQHAGSAFGM